VLRGGDTVVVESSVSKPKEVITWDQGQQPAAPARFKGPIEIPQSGPVGDFDRKEIEDYVRGGIWRDRAVNPSR
jgi:hypothetical protein